MTYRVVLWGTGNVGRHALAGIDARPDLELVGVWVSNPDKAGRDAGDLAGLGRSLGVAATDDAEAVLALGADCVVHTAMADHRLPEALADLEKILRAGANVVSSGPVFLQYPEGVVPAEMTEPLRDAALGAGVSLWVNGIDPGFANDWLPLVVTGISERIDEVRCLEILNYATYDQTMVMFDIMGFGRPLGRRPHAAAARGPDHGVGKRRAPDRGRARRRARLGRGALRTAARAREIEIASGTIEKGTAAGLRFEVRGMRGGRAVVVLEHVTRLADDIGPDWPQPTGQGGYRVVVRGEPNYTVDLQLVGTDGDHNTGGLKATAMRLVNAVPAVVEAARRAAHRPRPPADHGTGPRRLIRSQGLPPLRAAAERTGGATLSPSGGPPYLPGDAGAETTRGKPTTCPCRSTSIPCTRCRSRCGTWRRAIATPTTAATSTPTTGRVRCSS